jgi:hypothetical protein
MADECAQRTAKDWAVSLFRQSAALTENTTATGLVERLADETAQLRAFCPRVG